LGHVTGLIRTLEDHELRLLHDSALAVLSDVRADFAPARATPDQAAPAEGGGGRFPGGVPMRYTNMYFTTMPRRVRDTFDANTGGFTLFVYDLSDVRRPSTLQDVRDSIRLEVGFCRPVDQPVCTEKHIDRLLAERARSRPAGPPLPGDPAQPAPGRSTSARPGWPRWDRCRRPRRCAPVC
jgi:hypothetical protein